MRLRLRLIVVGVGKSSRKKREEGVATSAGRRTRVGREVVESSSDPIERVERVSAVVRRRVEASDGKSREEEGRTSWRSRDLSEVVRRKLMSSNVLSYTQLSRVRLW